jgi:hypothetical protein
VLSLYDFEITYRLGKLNPIDAPSRRLDYIFSKDDSNIILPILYQKLRVVRERGIDRELSLAYTPTVPTVRPQIVSILAPLLRQSKSP